MENFPNLVNHIKFYEKIHSKSILTKTQEPKIHQIFKSYKLNCVTEPAKWPK